MAAIERSDAEIGRLVDENRSLVEWSVNRYLARHVVGGAERDDLVSWGLLGLVSAARAFDPDRGFRFSTLAALAIERSIARGAMRVSSQQARTLSLDEAVHETGGSDPETRWVEMIRDEAAENQMVRAENLTLLAHAMVRLRPQQQMLIREHFFNGHSLADLAREWGTSRQAVAGQLRRALRSLRRKLELPPCGLT
jgi:RNA polymerase sigma factor (sigma-70 family)